MRIVESSRQYHNRLNRRLLGCGTLVTLPPSPPKALIDGPNPRPAQSPGRPNRRPKQIGYFGVISKDCSGHWKS